MRLLVHPRRRIRLPRRLFWLPWLLAFLIHCTFLCLTSASYHSSLLSSVLCLFGLSRLTATAIVSHPYLSRWHLSSYFFIHIFRPPSVFQFSFQFAALLSPLCFVFVFSSPTGLDSTMWKPYDTTNLGATFPFCSNKTSVYFSLVVPKKNRSEI